MKKTKTWEAKLKELEPTNKSQKLKARKFLKEQAKRLERFHRMGGKLLPIELRILKKYGDPSKI